MPRNWWGKFILLVFFTALSVLYVYPSVSGVDLSESKLPFKQKINLGLDLQGGLYMVLGVDFNKVFKDVVERQGQSLVERTKEKGTPVTNLKVLHEGPYLEDPRVTVDFDPAKKDELYALIKKEFWNLRLAGDQNGHFELGLTSDYRNDVRDRTLSQSMEVIRNRIDEFGVTEPIITSQGADRVVVELPGVKEVDRAKDLIGKTARLEFRLVADKVMDPQHVAGLVMELEQKDHITYKEGTKFSDYVAKINEAAKGKIPAGTGITFERTLGINGKEVPGTRIPYLLFDKVEVVGDDLQDANVSFDQQENRPVVAFSLNPRGATLFEKVTREHTHERFAIVLDNIVTSAPVIQSVIPGGHGQITLGRGQGDDTMKEAKDLAIVLRAGALPAQLEFLEQRVVGPSLGQDSIHKGAVAALVGCMLVFIFVGIYYRVSGLIAVLSLILNVIFVLACLVGLEATLTLPGIAGIALTVGIAVDSNVVIYERIREELRHGKRAHGAIESGFQKAFRTIMDANVTNAAAAIVLLNFGTGPIKGFAVTLLIGIVTTLFTAIFVCKLIFDFYLHRLELKGSDAVSI